MAYNAFGWVPPDHPNCQWSSTAADTCYEDVMNSFAAIFPKNKIVMGLLAGKAGDGLIVTPADAATFAAWANAGVPDGTYVNAISGALGA